MKPYEVIFFDLDHTLVDTRGQYEAGLRASLRQLYGEHAPSGFAERFMSHHEALWNDYDRRLITMQTLRRQRFLRTWQDYGVTKTEEEADHFHRTYDATFETTLKPFPGVVEMVRTLAQTHRLGIITNGAPDLQWRKLGIAGLQTWFPPQGVIISERIGKAKPHPSVFEAACQALSVDGRNALMVGDNFASDVSGARAFGMDAVWLMPDPQEPLPALERVYGELPLVRPEQLPEVVASFEQARS